MIELVRLHGPIAAHNIVRLLEWREAAIPEPQLDLLPKSRRSRRQSEISKKRAAFIGEVSRISHADIIARREYLDEWYDRLRREAD